MNGDEKSDKLETAPTEFVEAGEHEGLKSAAIWGIE
jgi:hypothetical protein